MEMSPLPPISLEKVSYSFGRAALRKQILFDVSVSVEAGEIIILTGPSGSGKTTLLTLMGALRAPQEGNLEILGHQLRGAAEADLVQVRRQIGYIFQSHNLLPALTVAQNVRMALQLDRERDSAADAERISAVLDRVGMIDHISKRVHQLSGGQRQRIAIARALINQPRIILADEPTASLDSASGRDVADLIQELAREGQASVVLVTHDNRILDIADRIVHLEDGRVKELREAVI
jgi:putative ABC transport system ATP-binding protein